MIDDWVLKLLSVSENILKQDSSLAHGELDIDLSAETLKKRTDLLREPEMAATAEKIASNWLSMIERVLVEVVSSPAVRLVSIASEFVWIGQFGIGDAAARQRRGQSPRRDRVLEDSQHPAEYDPAAVQQSRGGRRHPVSQRQPLQSDETLGGSSEEADALLSRSQQQHALPQRFRISLQDTLHLGSGNSFSPTKSKLLTLQTL